MLYHAKFDVAEAHVERLLSSARVARLLTVGDDGMPHIGIYPFVFGDGWIEVHLAQRDEQLADLRARPRVAVEIDEIFGPIPSHWSGPEATHADVYYRAAVFEAEAGLSGERDDVADHLRRLLERYQPEGGYDPVGENAEYEPYIAMLTVVCLRVVRRRAKYKLGQGSGDEHLKVLEALAARGRPEDVRALEEIRAIGLHNNSLTTAERDPS